MDIGLQARCFKEKCTCGKLPLTLMDVDLVDQSGRYKTPA
jgi:hypothetical protein